MSLKNEKPFQVLLFGSHPDLDNDDCWCGADFDTYEEALACFNDPAPFGKGMALSLPDSEYIMLDGYEDEPQIRKNPSFSRKAQRSDDGDWAREIAMQAGMGGGCQAFNDAMSY